MPAARVVGCVPMHAGPLADIDYGGALWFPNGKSLVQFAQSCEPTYGMLHRHIIDQSGWTFWIGKFPKHAFDQKLQLMFGNVQGNGLMAMFEVIPEHTAAAAME